MGTLHMGDTFRYHTSHPKYPVTEPSSFGQLWKGGINNHFHGIGENKKILIKVMLASSPQ